SLPDRPVRTASGSKTSATPRRYATRMSRAGIEGSVAVVTGASGNLGPVWIAALADAGATVVGIDLEETQVAGAVAVEAGDVRDERAISAIAERVAAEHGEPRILVNNAGIDQPPKP